MAFISGMGSLRSSLLFPVSNGGSATSFSSNCNCTIFSEHQILSRMHSVTRNMPFNLCSLLFYMLGTPLLDALRLFTRQGPSSHVSKLGTSRVTGPPWQIALNRNRRSSVHSGVSLCSNSTSFPPCESGQWKQVRPASTSLLLFDKNWPALTQDGLHL